MTHEMLETGVLGRCKSECFGWVLAAAGCLPDAGGERGGTDGELGNNGECKFVFVAAGGLAEDSATLSLPAADSRLRPLTMPSLLTRSS
jgi:hypothetical protein